MWLDPVFPVQQGQPHQCRPLTWKGPDRMGKPKQQGDQMPESQLPPHKEEQKVDRGTCQEVGLPPSSISRPTWGSRGCRQRSNSRDKQYWNNVEEDWIHQKEEEDWILEKEEEGWIWNREKVQ